MDLEIIEGLLEDLNWQTNQALDLVRTLGKGELFGEPLPTDMKDNLEIQVKARYAFIKDTLANLATEITK